MIKYYNDLSDIDEQTTILYNEGERRKCAQGQKSGHNPAIDNVTKTTRIIRRAGKHSKVKITLAKTSF